MTARTDINDPRVPTLPLAEFRMREKEDPNLFWRLRCGDHQNLLEEAIDHMDALCDAIAHALNYHLPEHVTEHLTTALHKAQGLRGGAS